MAYDDITLLLFWLEKVMNKMWHMMNLKPWTRKSLKHFSFFTSPRHPVFERAQQASRWGCRQQLCRRGLGRGRGRGRRWRGFRLGCRWSCCCQEPQEAPGEALERRHRRHLEDTAAIVTSFDDCMSLDVTILFLPGSNVSCCSYSTKAAPLVTLEGGEKVSNIKKTSA